MSTKTLILNVDDTDAARYVKTRILTRAGYEVIEAATAAQAMKALDESRPDLVLLDVRLPDGNGREMCARIKADPAKAQHPGAADLGLAHRLAPPRRLARRRRRRLPGGADGAEELLANVRALLRLRQAESERQAALDALKEADRRKDEFLAMLAHELRNPLAPIRNAVELLRVSDDPHVRERAREMVGRQAEHLARLVDDLLDVSRITRARSCSSLGRAPGRGDGGGDRDRRPLIDAQRHAFEVELPPQDLWLAVDSVRIAQAIGNLLHNAAKFTPRGGRIVLASRRDGAELRISVEDNGVGVTPDVLASAFDLFTQGDGRSTARRAGSESACRW
jgi:signal transduction histidine kinase